MLIVYLESILNFKKRVYCGDYHCCNYLSLTLKSTVATSSSLCNYHYSDFFFTSMMCSRRFTLRVMRHAEPCCFFRITLPSYPITAHHIVGLKTYSEKHAIFPFKKLRKKRGKGDKKKGREEFYSDQNDHQSQKADSK